ncbi:MAG TPA: family 78 glycoside hydrolase catalytic domain [Pseudonocardiaceae bacterium]|nr:family 78 glycoside hydrolase catalytic domain [Pseudonocardiaceae bacterium]
MAELSRRAALTGLAGTVALATLPIGASAARADDASAGRPAGASDLVPAALTAQHLTDPLGLDNSAPLFGWQLSASGTNRTQTAYQVRVATEPALLTGTPDVWDSGQVASAEQTARPYGGPALAARTRYYWSVRAWDETGAAGHCSAPAWLETALLTDADWTASWIGPGGSQPSPTCVVLQQEAFNPVPVTSGHTIGQSFASGSAVSSVAVLLLLTGSAPAGCTMTLRADGPTGTPLAQQTLTGLTPDDTGNALGLLELSTPAPAGRYHLELSDPRGAVNWLGIAADVYPDGSAYADGTMVTGDRTVYVIPPAPAPNPVLRREFSLSAPVTTARLYLCGLGYAQAWLNGHRIDNGALSPLWTNYDQRVFFTTHDVTALLGQDNAIGVALGRGFFASWAPDTKSTNVASWIAPPMLRAQLEVRLADGSEITVGTDGSWRHADGPTTYDSVFTGESYDAGRAARLAGWTEPGFTEDGWSAAAVVRGPSGRMQAYCAEPVAAGSPVAPVAVTTPVPGVTCHDFGVTLSGWAQLTGIFPAGSLIRLTYGEKLDADGRVYVAAPGSFANPSVVGRFQVDEFTAAGTGTETWQPSFSYKGFRYVEVIGATNGINLAAIPVHSALSSTMDISINEPRLQWIADAFLATARNNLYGLPTDTPTYSKLGWTGDAHFVSQSLLYGFGLQSLFAKWLEDIRLGQGSTGEIGLVEPIGLPADPTQFSPTWTGLYPYLVHRYWLNYGDLTVPQRHFDAVAAYLGWMLAQMPTGIAADELGDWFPPGAFTGAPPEGGTLVGTAYAIESLRTGVALANLLGRTAQAGGWQARADQLTTQFNATFLDTATGTYRTSVPSGYRQTSNAVALRFNLVPDAQHAAVLAGLVADIQSRQNHLDTGTAGTSALPYALSDNGRADVAHAVLTQTTYPSYGYLRGLGATTLWEGWDPTARSHDHYFLGSPTQWLVERVLGVEPLAPGWARLRIAPIALYTVARAGLNLRTVRGQISVTYQQANGTLTMDLVLPVNTTAEVALPGGKITQLGSGHTHLVAKL